MTSSYIVASDSNTKKFTNAEASMTTTPAKVWQLLKAYWQDNRNAATPNQPIPVRTLSPTELQHKSEAGLYRLGHSTVLIRVDGEYLLTDPVFSDRASPVQWAGPKRFHDAPISMAQLPKLKAVIISHDHYDHLDKHSVVSLADKVEQFVVPLKVGNHLRRWGINPDKIVELNWWQSIELGSIRLTATPTQHFSGRGLLDRDRTLWASWIVESQQAKIFFSGDSGYFGGFKEIGDRFGPFDLTLIETGAYNELWSEIHMLPEQSLQAHLDLQGKAMLPIHNGTFDLALHEWFEPLERIQQLARQHQVTLVTPIFGEEVSINQPRINPTWWQSVEPALQTWDLAEAKQ